MHRIALLILITLAAGCRGVTAPSPTPDRAADELCRRMSEDPDLGNVVVTGDTMFATRHDLVFTGRLSHHVTGRPVNLVRFAAWLSPHGYGAADTDPEYTVINSGQSVLVWRPSDRSLVCVGRLFTNHGRYRVTIPLGPLEGFESRVFTMVWLNVVSRDRSCDVPSSPRLAGNRMAE